MASSLSIQKLKQVASDPKYKKEQLAENIETFRYLPLIFCVLCSLFAIAYNLEGRESQAIATFVFLGIAGLSLFIFFFIRIAIRNNYERVLDVTIYVYCIILVFCLVGITILDSYDFYDLPAFIIGSLGFAYFYRTKLDRMLAVLITANIVLPIGISLVHAIYPSSLAVFLQLTVFILAVFISVNRENIRRRLFLITHALEASTREYREMSFRDPLTRLYNRRYLMDYLNRLFGIYSRKSDVFSLLILDVDYFKNINDSYGHDAGDSILQEMASLISSICRASDVCCRYGGEEFVVLMPDTDMKSAVVLAGRIRNSIKSWRFEHSKNSVTVSIGVAHVTEGDTPATLFKRADQALYIAKSEGRDRVISN